MNPPNRPKPAAEERDLRMEMLEDAPVALSYRLNYVANSFVAALYARMQRDEGISRPEFIILLCLSVRNGITAQEVAEATHRPKNNLSRAVRSLESRGLVRRRTDPADQRRQPIEMTGAGREMFDRLLPMAREREEEMMAALDHHERRVLADLLMKISVGF
jgi:DNA-binding MarR family transcriptional regulator